MSTVKNAFEVYREDFRKDIGLDYQKHPAEYIAYVNARLQQAMGVNLYNINDTLKQLVEVTRANKPK